MNTGHFLDTNTTRFIIIIIEVITKLILNADLY